MTSAIPLRTKNIPDTFANLAVGQRFPSVQRSNSLRNFTAEPFLMIQKVLYQLLHQLLRGTAFMSSNAIELRFSFRRERNFHRCDSTGPGAFARWSRAFPATRRGGLHEVESADEKAFQVAAVDYGVEHAVFEKEL